MKITDIRTMRLAGPRVHSVGGEESTNSKIIIRIDTDAEIYGLGEADNFMGVREAMDYIRARLLDRNPFDIKRFRIEMFYGALPPHSPDQTAPESARHSSTKK